MYALLLVDFPWYSDFQSDHPSNDGVCVAGDHSAGAHQQCEQDLHPQQHQFGMLLLFLWHTFAESCIQINRGGGMLLLF